MKMKFGNLVSRVQESLFHLWQSWVCYPLTFLRYQKVALFSEYCKLNEKELQNLREMKSHDFSGADELSESIAKMWRSSRKFVTTHQIISQETKAETLLLFKKVKQTLKYYSKYPHEISGEKNNVS
jgi:hypothetical protein